jgi:pimeloyl-ACP methyl ester carboxylesterase
MSFATSADGARIHYEVQGTGEPVVLLPGLGMALATWSEVGGKLAGENRVISIDPRGSGDSDKPDQPYTGELVAGDVAAVLDDVGVERAHVVGQSMGGMIAQQLALHHPERVASLVLLSTFAAPDEWGNRVLEVRRTAIERLGLAEQFRMSLLFVFSPRSFREMREWIAGLERRLAEHPPDQRAYLRQLDFCNRHDARERLGVLTVPALVISGEQDVLTSAIQGRELAELIPGAEYREYAGASHGLLWERGDELAQVIGAFVAR